MTATTNTNTNLGLFIAICEALTQAGIEHTPQTTKTASGDRYRVAVINVGEIFVSRYQGEFTLAHKYIFEGAGRRDSRYTRGTSSVPSLVKACLRARERYLDRQAATEAIERDRRDRQAALQARLGGKGSPTRFGEEVVVTDLAGEAKVSFGAIRREGGMVTITGDVTDEQARAIINILES